MLAVDTRWAAVIVNYEPGSLLRDCVQSVLADTSAGAVDLVVVDNGSNDGSVALAQAAAPSLRVVAAPGNVGYARAANLGIAATRAAIVAVLNADLTVGPGTAGAMVARFELTKRWARADRVSATSTAPTTRRRASDPSVPLAVGHGVFGLVVAGESVHGALPPARRRPRGRALGRLGVRRRDVAAARRARRRRRWDERYFMYMEDLDLCWRLRGAGWNIAYEPGGEVVHVQGASTSRRPYRMLLEHHRSAWRFARRSGSPACVRSCCRSLRFTWDFEPYSRWPSMRCARPNRCVPAASLDPMGKASRTKRRRAAVRSAKRSRQQQLVVRAHRHRRRRSASRSIVYAKATTKPPVGPYVANQNNQLDPHNHDSHWHAALGVYDCDTWVGDQHRPGVVALARRDAHGSPARAGNTNVYAGLHSHADGIIHMEPLVDEEAGRHATVGKYFQFGGWKLSSTGFNFVGTKAARTATSAATSPARCSG